MTTAPLEAQYTGESVCATSPVLLAVNSIVPRAAARHPGMACRAAYTMARRFTCSSRSISSALDSGSCLGS